MIVLRGVVPEEVYSHFLTFCVAMSLLLHPDYKVISYYLNYAQELLKTFVSSAPKIYGPTFTVYNVHSLLHLHEDVEHFRCSLNEISAFPFENYLQTLKKYVRNSSKPLVQVVKRLTEAEESNMHKKNKKIATHIGYNIKDGCFVLHDSSVAFVKQSIDEDTFSSDVISAAHIKSLFTNPCDSKLLNIGFITSRYSHVREKLLPRSQLVHKAACLPCDGGYAVIPLLHGSEH